MHIFCLSLLFDDAQEVCLASRLHSEQIYALTGRSIQQIICAKVRPRGRSSTGVPG